MMAKIFEPENTTNMALNQQTNMHLHAKTKDLK
jgi:hypothetical protein